MSEIKIRLGDAKDIHQCLDIYFHEPFFEQYSPTHEGMNKLFHETISDQTQRFLVAEDHAGIRGFALFDLKGAFSRSGYLRLIVIDKNYRNQQIGERLILHIEQNLISNNGFCLLVTKNNTKAQEFYQKLGFFKVGEIDNYVKIGITEYIFFKQRKS